MSAADRPSSFADWAAATCDLDLRPVHAAMRAALKGRGDARDALGLYAQLSYHLGWTDEQGRAVQQRGGKGIRPLLCLTCCAAMGADPERATGMAAAIELTHEFSLIHDDIEDGDRQRRGRAALWTLSGIPQAINAGDALFSIARQQIASGAADLGAARVLDAYRHYDNACLELAEGQFLDIDFETASAVEIPAYLRMVEGKTGALLGAAAALGAIAGGADHAVAEAFDRYGRAVGVGFQIQDDVLGIWGDPVATGKPAGNDLLRRKRSLPVILAAAEPGLSANLSALYAAEAPPRRAALTGLIRDMETAGIRAAAEGMARDRAQSALDALEGLSLAEAPRRVLEGLVVRAVERDH